LGFFGGKCGLFGAAGYMNLGKQVIWKVQTSKAYHLFTRSGDIGIL